MEMTCTTILTTVRAATAQSDTELPRPPSSLTNKLFLLDVVFDSQVDLYDAREGVGSVVIRALEPGDNAITASAGGYGLLLSPGDYTVEAKLPDGRVAVQEASIGANNVKVEGTTSYKKKFHPWFNEYACRVSTFALPGND